MVRFFIAGLIMLAWASEGRTEGKDVRVTVIVMEKDKKFLTARTEDGRTFDAMFGDYTKFIDAEGTTIDPGVNDSRFKRWAQIRIVVDGAGPARILQVHLPAKRGASAIFSVQLWAMLIPCIALVFTFIWLILNLGTSMPLRQRVLSAASYFLLSLIILSVGTSLTLVLFWAGLEVSQVGRDVPHDTIQRGPGGSETFWSGRPLVMIGAILLWGTSLAVAVFTVRFVISLFLNPEMDTSASSRKAKRSR